MIANPGFLRMTPQEYLVWESKQPLRYAYGNGEWFLHICLQCQLTVRTLCSLHYRFATPLSWMLATIEMLKLACCHQHADVQQASQ